MTQFLLRCQVPSWPRFALCSYGFKGAGLFWMEQWSTLILSSVINIIEETGAWEDESVLRWG
jgi:hypothetical protein